MVGGTDIDVDEAARIDKVRVALNTLKNIWRSKEIRPQTKLRIFNANIKSVLFRVCRQERHSRRSRLS